MNYNDGGSVTPEPHGGNTDWIEVEVHAQRCLDRFKEAGLSNEGVGIVFSIIVAHASYGPLPAHPVWLGAVCSLPAEDVQRAIDGDLCHLFRVEGGSLEPVWDDVVRPVQEEG